MKKAAVIYFSNTGNTEKVAFAIKKGLESAGVDVLIQRAREADSIDFFDYDLVCIGTPSIHWQVPKPLNEFLMKKFYAYRDKGFIKPCAPKVPGKNTLIFCTYAGPHTGVNEAVPVLKHIGQFFEHFGFTILDEWSILGEFHGSEENSTMGLMGDIRGRPNQDDLEKIERDAAKLASKI
jgi:multimeric flavodoxin WrbA